VSLHLLFWLNCQPYSILPVSRKAPLALPTYLIYHKSSNFLT